MFQSNQKGFTLVELAIVLVIIGLIISSVLVGQDLIKAAQLRATTKQIQDYQVAVNTFLGKYGNLPGDLNSAKFGLCDGELDTSGCAGAAASANTTGCDGEPNLGDGDGIIEDDNGGAATIHDAEISCFWANLTTPGKELVSGSYEGYTSTTRTGAVNDGVTTNMPSMKFGSAGISVFSDGTSNYFIAGVTGSSDSDAYATTNVFIPTDAYNIDAKIDDGSPTTGDVQSRRDNASNPNTAATTNAAASTAVCNNTAPDPDEYQFTATTALCTLRFALQSF